MRYDISKQTASAMPALGKGTECIKLLLSQASKDTHEPFIPMFFPVLGAHISGTEFMYPDNTWKEPTGMMANLVAKSGDNKGQFPILVEAICRDDHHASMSFSVRRNTYRCFVCDAHGGPIDLVMKYLNKGFRDATRWLADEHNKGSDPWCDFSVAKPSFYRH